MFRLHSTGGTSSIKDIDLLPLLNTICRPDRRMTKLIIDGHPLPLNTIADVISVIVLEIWVPKYWGLGFQNKGSRGFHFKDHLIQNKEIFFAQ